MQKLDKATYKLLEKLYKVQKMEEGELFLFVGHTDKMKLEPCSHLLLQQKMIKVYDVAGVPDGEGGHIGAERFYEIDLLGKSYVEEVNRLRHKDKIDWLRYIITTVIAAAALITAIVSIILQYR